MDDVIDSDRLSAEVTAAAKRVKQPFNRCRTVSHGLADALMKAGIPARVIRCSGLKPYAPEADRRWLKLGAQLYWTHYVVRVEDTVIDLTRRQFIPSAEKIHTQAYAEYAAEWLEIERDLDWEQKHGLDKPMRTQPAPVEEDGIEATAPSP